VEAKTGNLQAELRKEKLDPDRVYALADELSEARKKLLRSRCHSILLVRETLTPEQLKTLVSMVDR